MNLPGAQLCRVGADEKNPPGPRLIAGDDPQIGLDAAAGGDPEAEVAVERAEFAGVVRAATIDLRQYQAELRRAKRQIVPWWRDSDSFHRFPIFAGRKIVRIPSAQTYPAVSGLRMLVLWKRTG